MQIPYVGPVIGSRRASAKRHLLLAGLALRVDGDVGHRPRPEERDEGDQVLELGRLHLAQRLAHARTTRTGRRRVESPRRSIVVGLRRRRAGPARGRGSGRSSAERLVDHVEVAQPEEVHLQQAERLDVLHRELRHDLLVGALLLERHELDERPVGDDDAGGVDRVLADEALERLREVDDLADDLVGVVGLAELGAGLQALLEVDLRALGDQLRDPVDDAVGDVEHAPRVAHGGARGHRPEGDDLGDAVAAVLLGDVVDHPLAAVDREVDVDVRHRLAARVQEALEEQVVADRVDVGDLEAVRDERARRRAAARPDADRRSASRSATKSQTIRK